MPRSRSRRRGHSSSGSATSAPDEQGKLYFLELLRGKHGEPFPMFDIEVPVDVPSEGLETAELERRVVPHVCTSEGEGYYIRVSNHSRKHIACHVTVDGENALLKEGSLIVAPRDTRELPGFLVSKNFLGKEYVKEYRSFRFSRPRVVEASGIAAAAAPVAEEYKMYGKIVCEVYEAVLDEEVESDQELHGQSTHYRGVGLNGDFDNRTIVEGKKTHLVYSSVTAQGPRAATSNSTRGRWWIRGSKWLRTLEVRYREPHSLMLLGVRPQALGIQVCKEETGFVKGEGKKEEEEDEDKLDKLPGGVGSGFVECCDLTAGDADGAWSVEKDTRAEPVNVLT